MNYRVFRCLVIGSTISLLATLALFFVVLFTGGLGSVKNLEITLQLKQIVQKIADNQAKLISGSQQVSELLNIPQEQYSQFRTPKPKEMLEMNRMTSELLEKKGHPLEIAFYDALRYLDQSLEQDKAWEQLNQLLDSEAWKGLLQTEQLRLERSKDMVLLFLSDNKLLPRGQVAPQWFKLSTMPSEPIQLKISSVFDSYIGVLDINEELIDFVRKQSKQLYSLARQYNQMYRFITSKVVAKQLAAKQLYIKSLQPAKVEKIKTTGKRVLEIAQTDWEVRTRDEQVVARFYFDIDSYKLLWNDKSYQSIQLLQSDWGIFVNNVDTRTEGQRQEDQMRKYLVKMLSDSAFLLQMKQYGLQAAQLPPRESTYYEYYDLLNVKGEKMASFALQKRIGEAYLMDRDDVKIRGLKSFLTGANDLQILFKESPVSSVTQNSGYLPERSLANQKESASSEVWGGSPDLKVILLIGTHDNIADVIMLISINKDNKMVTMLSLPRDLYYNETKINILYAMYGPTPFMEVLSEITGITVTQYISMDMYAFIEVVDLINGIDVYLKEDLIDPTYKIKQMGQWETLVMRKGQHHLDGLGALRYSRSRHTSNDFERSERQQLILNQVAEKLRTQLSSPQKLLPFLKVMQKYVKTNISTADIARYWLEYGAYKRNFGNTISTDNVLYYTWTNYLELNSEELLAAQQDDNFPRGSFILLPRGNDWNLIRNYLMYLQEN